MDEQADLWQRYQTVRFVAAEPISFDKFGVITACNPRSQRLSEHANKIRNQQMIAEFVAKGWLYVAVNVCSPDMSWCEPSFAVEASQSE